MIGSRDRTRVPKWGRVTALYGGTFDPPHVGHREAVQGLFDQPGIKQVVVIPSAQPPHKLQATLPEHRVAMTRLAFAPTIKGAVTLPPEVEIDLREIERARTTGRPSYSFETVQELKRERGEVAFVIGTDQLEALSTWHRFPELLGLCHWLVLERKSALQSSRNRPGEETLRQWQASGLVRPVGTEAWSIHTGANSASQMEGAVLQLVPTPARALAARDIRESLQRTGQPPQDALLEPVFEYLKTHRLYGSASN